MSIIRKQYAINTALMACQQQRNILFVVDKRGYLYTYHAIVNLDQNDRQNIEQYKSICKPAPEFVSVDYFQLCNNRPLALTVGITFSLEDFS